MKRKLKTSPGTLVVEEDPVAGEHPVGLSVVFNDPVGVQLSDTFRSKSATINNKMQLKAN